MKASDMRGKSPAELKELMLELLKEQFNLRMQRGTEQLARPSEMKRVRREIARIKTVMNELKSGKAS
ncbi:MAG: 50S ribosomal protein L29 [Gammaproteobacteria bacterium SHHR-1]|uniref:50S ribosomal protein L29 n=1 Tax=Magnetovirga frankeli TaxID=947516 RepID=UPI001292FBB0|nr:50S ribosomal protein L29 [gamma proteobacterium SS-5]